MLATSHYGVPSAISSAMPSGSSSPQLSLRSGVVDQEGNAINASPSFINLQIYIPELSLQKCLTVCLDELVWDIKRKLFKDVGQNLPQPFNYGLFLPPCDGRAGKFLLEDRPIRDYPFHDCAAYVELKHKKRVYKMLQLDEKALKQIHSKSNRKKFLDYVQNRNVEKVEKMCSQGFDPNLHDSQGDTPLTLASGMPNNRAMLVQLVGGGAHLDFRNLEGQTGMHKAAFLSIVENVKTLLELGASPNYRDPIGLTPLYYNMLTTDSNPECAEMLLSEAADIYVQDMHANEPLHQACKNGLVHHVEHLLFYGSNINAQNVNGNTPLHVCAVNNRVDCARVLLYRGADLTFLNKQAQTAVHVAHIVNNLAVAEAIQNHNPHNTAPFVGMPKYNTRRRMTNNQISRRRSLSHSSMCSIQSDRYQVPAHLLHPQSINGKHLSPSPSCSTICMANGSTGDYGTLKKYPPEYVQAHCGFEANTPRILVIPRGPKGFGFILRGANQSESEVDFKPSPTIPALQFFEGVETTGMAMRAGLRPGDFLLEINGIDVRCASHEQVVHLIHQAEDTISLKVITIEVNAIRLNGQKQHYAPSFDNKNNSVSRNNGLPPMVPDRNPVTSLSFGRTTLSGRCSLEGNYGKSNNNSMPPCNYQPSSSSFSSSPDCEEYKSSSSGGAGGVPHSTSNEQLRCASVKNRPSAARRISAAELEHLMIRQGTSTSQFQPIPYEQDSTKNQGAKKFTSVAEMKRRKQRSSNNNSSSSFVTALASRPESTANDPSDYKKHPFPLKSFNSSPDLATKGETGDYSRPFKPVLRPKTPPPPPPPGSTRGKSNGYAAGQEPPPQPEVDYNEPIASSSKAVAGAPPPPPPPPSNLLQKQPTAICSKPTVDPTEQPINKSDCRGISAEALLNVKLKKVGSSAPSCSSNADATPASKAEPVSTTKKPADFDFDLRSALARRRSKVTEEEESSGNTSSDDGKMAAKSCFQTNKAVAPPKETSVVNMNRYGGLSLRESVRENVQAPTTKNSGKLQHHSPPGFSTKKDSGYTSSRTSLEPSECGDEPQHQTQTTPVCSSSSSSTTLVEAASTTIHQASDHTSEMLNSAAAGHRVAILSQQLEDSYGNVEHKNLKNSLQETISPCNTAATSVSNGVVHDRKNSELSSGRPLFFENPMRTPAVDYEEYFPDQEKPSICSNKTETSASKFIHKKLAEWNSRDVCDWLADLHLQQYSDSFAEQSITGSDLVSFDRARFTFLGVTMIRHRQAMENSLRNYI